MAGENINRRLNIYINDKEVVNSMRGVTAEMRKVQNQMRNLNAGAEDYEEQLQALKDTYSRLQAEQSRFRQDLSQTQGVLQRLKNALGPVATGILAAFTIEAVGNAFVNKIRQAYDVVVDFDQKQADLAATMQKSRIQIAGLTLDAIKIGATTAYSATEVSVLQNELAKLGKTAPEIRNMTGAVLNAATSLETDLGSAAVLVGGQLNSYGESATKAGKYSDILANSVNISATSYDYLATALPKTSAVAALNNVTFEKLNGTMGVLADQNIAAETAGTGFRNILLESSKVGKPYQVLLDQIKNSTDQSKKATELFGKENATVAVILANNTEKIISNTKALENSAGSAEKLAKEKMNSLKGSIEGFSGAWEGFILSIEKGDGAIAKIVRGFIDFGTTVIGLITPMQQLSKSIENEQLELNKLVSKITSTNTSNEERVQLLNQLSRDYPDLIKNIDVETVSNEELTEALNKVNEMYVKRIALQKIVEKLENAQGDQANFLAQKLEQQNKIFEKLNQIKGQFALKVKIDFDDLKGSAAKMRKELEQKGISTSRMSGIASDLEMLHRMEVGVSRTTDVVTRRSQEVDRASKSLGINTEAQNENNKALAAAAEELKKLRDEAKGFGMKNADTAPENEVKVWLAAYKEKMKYSDEMSEKDKKKLERERLAAIKHADDLAKTEAELQKRLLDIKRSSEDLKTGVIKDDYDRERAQIKIEYDRKIQDTLALIRKEDEEIKKLRALIADPKTNKSDSASYKRQLADRLAIQTEYNSTFLALEAARNSKLGAAQEKYLAGIFKKEQEAAARKLQNLKTTQGFELAGIDSLEKAKQLLSQTLSSDELRKVTTLEGAKKIIKERHLKEQYELESRNLEQIMSLYESFLRGDFQSGFTILSEEEKAAVLVFLDEAKAKLAAIKGNPVDGAPDGAKKEFQSGVDLFGYSIEQWQEMYANLDTIQGKIAGLGMVSNALQGAFGTYFKFLEAGENRALANFTKSADKKKKSLADQLEKGYLSQELYNAKVAKIDAEVAAKKAQIEYKQAKRQKTMAIADVVVKTAMAIMQGYAQLGPIGGTIAAVVIGALGAMQVATISKQPLPSEGGFKEGGYTGDGDADQYAGPAHKGEYVIPKKVLFSGDPVMPNIINYVEAKRKGRAASFVSDESGSDSPMSFGGGGSGDAQTNSVLTRLAAILEKLEQNGLIAYLVNDLKTARKIDDKIKEYKKLKDTAKP